MIDPDNPCLISITDNRGDGAMLVVCDRPGCTAGEFLVQGEWLVWRTHEGDKARIDMNDDGSTPIEFFRWLGLSEDDNPYSVINTAVVPGTAIIDTNVRAAGAAVDDVPSAARFATNRTGFTELSGNDALTGSDTTFTLV
ncbi:MAG: hypothetical protein H7245_15565 [Candidatus Saccharibacteria bacterium]|nr:hypothetical protein [Pseudorhodobacter sp.]